MNAPGLSKAQAAGTQKRRMTANGHTPYGHHGFVTLGR